MATAQRDTEITLGTGRMLVLFFTFVLVCAVFFAIGFSLGRKTGMVGANNLANAATGTPAAVVRPSAAAKQNTPQAARQSTDFSFYKSVGAKGTDSELSPQEPTAQSPNSTAEPPKTLTPVSSSASV